MLAWEKGLKTTYYLRTLGAGGIEQSTVDINRHGMQPRWMKSKSASANIQLARADAEPLTLPRATCNVDGSCEACQ